MGGVGMKILVCGGAGYIGSHMAQWLAAQGHAPTVLDNRKLQQDFGLVLPAWQDGLKRVMAEIAAA